MAASSDPMPLRRINDEVLFASCEIVRVGARDIETLKEQALRNPRHRIRICAHRDEQERLHEMLIVHTNQAYVRPHKHINKSESFHVIEGTGEVVLFDEQGTITNVIPMGDYASGRKFYYRIAAPIYHTLLITSEIVVFHEATNGPFIKGDAVFAPWSPEEMPVEPRQNFQKDLAIRVRRFLEKSRK
jgi:cupin fold WbuC family metalloprotein